MNQDNVGKLVSWTKASRVKFMKNFSSILLTAGFLLLSVTVFAQTNLSLTDRQQITENLESLVQAVNTGDIQQITFLISPDNPTLLADIQERVMGGVSYELDYEAEQISQDRVEVKGRFTASGVGWDVSGLSTYFVFEKQNNQWFIVDTDFHNKLGADYVSGIVKKVLIFGGPIFLLLFGFWLWMLIDCIQRDFDRKTLWIILLIFLSPIAPALYFFTVKRKNITRKPLEFEA